MKAPCIRLLIGLLALPLFVLGAATACAQQTHYDVITLPFEPIDMNDEGGVVGVNTAGEGIVWSDGEMVNLGLEILPLGINNGGQVVGRLGGGGSPSFIWQDGIFVNLPSFPEMSDIPLGINDAGLIIGYAEGEETWAVMWQDDEIANITPDNHPYAIAAYLNEMGQIVIYSAPSWPSTTDDGYHLLTGSSTVLIPGALNVYGLTDDGRVLITRLTGNVVGTYLWSPDSTEQVAIPFGSLAISPTGEKIVGSTGGGANRRAWLWDNGTSTDLNDLIDPDTGWTLNNAYLINRRGEIAGTGTLDGEAFRRYLLRPRGCLVVTADTDEEDANTGDGFCSIGDADGSCTLRAAIEEANALDGKQCITFDIRDGAGEPVVDPVINPFSALPAIMDSLSIDGTTQPGSDRVRIEGLAAGVGANGLVIEQAHDVSLKGLAFYDFDGTGIAIIGGSDHLIEDTFVGWNGSSPRPNGAAGIHVSGGAIDVTIGSLEDDQINHIADGIRIEGEDTRKIKVLKNALEVPPDWINGEGVRLPIDLGDEGPMCATWQGPAEGAPNDAMPSPRVLDLAGGFVNGKTVPGSMVIVYRVQNTGSGLSRYWPRMMHPVADGEAGPDGLFTIDLDLPVGAKISLVAIDPEGNTSEPTQLRRPVIVLPGIGGTWLRDQNATNLWLPLALTSDDKNARMRRLAMQSNGDTGQEPLVATEVIESVLGLAEGYGALHERLESAGYPGHVHNQTPSDIDQWRFPNDWRRSADKLADILSGMIDVLTVDSGAFNGPARSCQVDLVAHSNGGLIASVYVRRDHDQAQDRVHRLVTSGTPYLGAAQAVAAHTRGYIFDVDDSLLGAGWNVAWGDMTVMTRNVAGAYGLMPSRAYYEAANPNSASHAHGFTVVDLYNDGLSGYDAVLDMLTRAKVDENNVPFGFARNASVWNLQQTKVHDETNDWRDFEGPPQIFRQVGRLVGSTATGWSLRPGPHFLAAGSTTRSEPDDTDRHRAYRERLDAIKGLGDGTVPLVSATMGRDPSVGREDFSGVNQSQWINDFEYFRCTHTGLVESGCKAIVSGPDALPRIVDILKSGHEVRFAANSRPEAADVHFAVSSRPEAERSDEDEVEIFYAWSTAPALVMIEDSEGRRTGPTDPELPGAIEYSIPGITYHASSLGASFALPADGAYSVTLTAAAPDARVYLIRQRASLESITQILHPDQALDQGGRLTFSLAAGGTADDAPWLLDADGDGTPETEVPPAAILAGTSSVPALPIPQPSAFDVGIPTGAEPMVRALRVPDTGTDGWTFALTGGASWLSLSATEGEAPAELEVSFDPAGLPEGPVETMLTLTLANGAYATTFEVPVTMRVGVTVSEEPGVPEGLPDQLTLLPAYPNPAAGATTIRYGLPTAGAVRIEVFDLLGRRVTLLADGPQEAGWHEAVLDGKILPTGVYVVRLHAGAHVRSRRLTVLR